VIANRQILMEREHDPALRQLGENGWLMVAPIF
jgi:hypothetical protein